MATMCGLGQHTVGKQMLQKGLRQPLVDYGSSPELSTGFLLYEELPLLLLLLLLLLPLLLLLLLGDDDDGYYCCCYFY